MIVEYFWSNLNHQLFFIITKLLILQLQNLNTRIFEIHRMLIKTFLTTTYKITYKFALKKSLKCELLPGKKYTVDFC